MISFSFVDIVYEDISEKPFKSDEKYDYFKTNTVVNGKKTQLIFARDKTTNLIYPKTFLKNKKKESENNAKV